MAATCKGRLPTDHSTCCVSSGNTRLETGPPSERSEVGVGWVEWIQARGGVLGKGAGGGYGGAKSLQAVVEGQ